MVDIIIILLLLLGVYRGYTRGGVVMLCKLCGFIVGLLLAYLLNAQLGEELAPRINTTVNTARIICFSVLWIAIPLLMTIAGHLITLAVKIVWMGPLNRLAGAAIGFVIYFLMLSSCIGFLSYANIGAQQLQQSRCAVRMLEVSHKLIDAVPPDFRQRVEKAMQDYNAPVSSSLTTRSTSLSSPSGSYSFLRLARNVQAKT